jgi:predicted Zn finger-like uncharacterized protein
MSSMVDESATDFVPDAAREDLLEKGPGGGVDAATSFYASCGTCRASYMIDPVVLGEGRRVKCMVCSNIWFQSSSKLRTLKVGIQLPKKKCPCSGCGGFTDHLAHSFLNVLQETDKVSPYPPDRYDGKKFESGATKHDRTGAVTLFVGNLPFSVTEDKLRYFFAKPREYLHLLVLRLFPRQIRSVVFLPHCMRLSDACVSFQLLQCTQRFLTSKLCDTGKFLSHTERLPHCQSFAIQLLTDPRYENIFLDPLQVMWPSFHRSWKDLVLTQF